ncbi:MAG: nucleoside hydrolase [Eubacteriales bacterium]
MTREQYLKNLDVPEGRVDAILDTDTYNEIDDQFALAYMLLSDEKINTVGICAAPFLNERSTGAADGMRQSYNEIIKVLGLMGRDDMMKMVRKGSESFLVDESEPVISDAARFMADKSREYSPEHPLYIVAIGAITNVASAILMEPKAMTENTVVIWLGGHSSEWPDTSEFNMKQDIAAARVVFRCGVPLVQLPCYGVVSAFRTTKAELEYWLKGTNPLGEYLLKNTVDEVEKYISGRRAWSRSIWDVTAVAWLLNDGNRFMQSYLKHTPLPQYDGHYSELPDSHLYRYVFNINRDELFTDLFTKISGSSSI